MVVRNTALYLNHTSTLTNEGGELKRIPIVQSWELTFHQTYGKLYIDACTKVFDSKAPRAYIETAEGSPLIVKVQYLLKWYELDNPNVLGRWKARPYDIRRKENNPKLQYQRLSKSSIVTYMDAA